MRWNFLSSKVLQGYRLYESHDTLANILFIRCFSLAYKASGESLSRSFEHSDRHVLLLFFAMIRKKH